MGKETCTDKTLLRRETRFFDGYTYEYTLSVRESPYVASYRLALYSVKVKLTNDFESDERELSDCFADLGKATRFFELLVRNLATPENLIYVFEDCLDL